MKLNKLYLLFTLFMTNIVFSNVDIPEEIQAIDNLLYPDDLTYKEEGLSKVIEMGERGSLDAQKALGQYYSLGDKPNYEKAVYWYQKAVKMNNDMMSASYILDYWHQGLVDNIKDKDIFNWHKFFVDEYKIDKYAYFVGSHYFDGKIVSKDYQLALTYLEKALGYGDFYSARLIAEMYKEGLGVNKNIEKAKQYYMKSIEVGDLWGVHYIASIYLNEAKSKGIIFPKSELFEFDLKEDDVKLKQKLSLNLGLSYLYGWGVAKDLNSAKFYIQTAVDEGNDKVKYLLDGL